MNEKKIGNNNINIYKINNDNNNNNKNNNYIGSVHLRGNIFN